MTSVWATSEKGNQKIERMSVSDPGEKIEWAADSEPRKNERVPSSGFSFLWKNITWLFSFFVAFADIPARCRYLLCCLLSLLVLGLIYIPCFPAFCRSLLLLAVPAILSVVSLLAVVPYCCLLSLLSCHLYPCLLSFPTVACYPCYLVSGIPACCRSLLLLAVPAYRHPC